jgi:hypothetical protein
MLVMDDRHFFSIFYEFNNLDLWLCINVFISEECLHMNNKKYWDSYFMPPQVIGGLECGPFEDIGLDFKNGNIMKYTNLE